MESPGGSVFSTEAIRKRQARRSKKKKKEKERKVIVTGQLNVHNSVTSESNRWNGSIFDAGAKPTRWVSDGCRKRAWLPRIMPAARCDGNIDMSGNARCKTRNQPIRPRYEEACIPPPPLFSSLPRGHWKIRFDGSVAAE